MQTISCLEDIQAQDKYLSQFIMSCCPWVNEDWNPDSIGFIFIIGNSDINKVSSLCITPHISRDETYKELMTIDLSSFDLWEHPSTLDPISNYWNVVAVLGQEFGCSLFLSSDFVLSLPELQARLENIQEDITNQKEA